VTTYLCQHCGREYAYERVALPENKGDADFFCSVGCAEAYRARTGRTYPPVGREIPLGPFGLGVVDAQSAPRSD
jgi:hypothetical protein